LTWGPPDHCKTPQAKETDRWVSEHKDKFKNFAQPSQDFAFDDRDLSDQNQQETIEASPQQKHKKEVRINEDGEIEAQSVNMTSQWTRKSSQKPPKKQTVSCKQLEKKRSEFNNTTRWLPDSAFTTYFGKPAFHSYGRANTKPTCGGVNYGNNLLTHNINAECGDHPPPTHQVYPTALRKGLQKSAGLRVPKVPFVK